MTKLNQKVSTLHTVHPTDCAILQQVRDKYASWLWCYDHGYICYSRKNRKQYEHRLVCQLVAGQSIKGFHVHHINECITDNQVANLRVLTASEHAKLHSSSTVILVSCNYCGRKIEKTASQAKRNNENFCNGECASLSRRRVVRPSASELFDLMVSVNNWTTLGKMFGVSATAVRKWAKTYQLDMSVCDGRKTQEPLVVIETTTSRAETARSIH